MGIWRLRRVVAGVLVVGLGVAALGAELATVPATLPTTGEAGWVPLFNGKDLGGFYTFLQKSGKNKDPGGYFKVEEGMIHMMGPGAEVGGGAEIGYLCTEKAYGDFHLRFEYKWGTVRYAPRAALPRDNGCLYLVMGEDKVWPSGVEFQLQEGEAGDIYLLNNAYTAKTTVASLTDRQKVFRADGQPWAMTASHLVRGETADQLTEWNKVELIVKGGEATQMLNGKVVARVTGIARKAGGAAVAEGRIAFQCQAAEVYFRKVEVREGGALNR